MKVKSTKIVSEDHKTVTVRIAFDMNHCDYRFVTINIPKSATMKTGGSYENRSK